MKLLLYILLFYSQIWLLQLLSYYINVAFLFMYIYIFHFYFIGLTYISDGHKTTNLI